MKVYIRHFDEAESHLLTEASDLGEVDKILASIAEVGAYSDHDDVTGKVQSQYLVNIDGKTGFEIIVGGDA